MSSHVAQSDTGGLSPQAAGHQSRIPHISRTTSLQPQQPTCAAPLRLRGSPAKMKTTYARIHLQKRHELKMTAVR